MKWETDLIKDIRTGTEFDDIDYPTGHSLGYSGLEITDCNRSSLLEHFLKVKDNAKSILEIGIGRNENESFAHVFFNNKNQDTKYIGIDLEDRSWLVDCGENIYTIQGDSSNYKENVKIFKTMGVKKIDFILIDGWHSINQILKDWEYTNLLSPKGIVAFHDVSCHPGPYNFINSLDESKWNIEKNCCYEDWGIGFVWKK
jgi:hypothetical protein